MFLFKIILLPIRYIGLLLTLFLLGSLHIIFILVFGYKRGTALSIAWLWGKLNCFFMGAILKVKGLENLPKKGGAVILFSHSSFADIAVIFASYRGVFNFAAKSFVFKYPIIGSIGRIIKTIEIPDDREKAIEQYNLAQERLKNGDRFMISPEGGRSSGEEILPFKSGPFLFAMKSKANLIPMVIYGAHKVWPREDKLPNLKALFSKVYVEFLPVVEISTFTDENRKIKAEEIRQDMISCLKSYQQK